MQAYIFFSSIVLTFMGLFVGYFLAINSPEEEDIIKKYVKYSQLGLIFILIGATGIMYEINVFISIITAILIGAGFYFKEIQTSAYYPVLGFLFYLGISSKELFYVQTFLIFAIGITIGTFYYWNHKKIKWYKNCLNLFYNHILFLVISTIIYFII